MSRSMIKQQNSGGTGHVVLYAPRQSTKITTLYISMNPLYKYERSIS